MERIVLIDDNMNDVMLMRRVLERAGYEIFYANSGEEGLKLAAETIPNCILVDYRMPGMDGYEFCRRIKSDDELQSIPVLMLTGADSTRNVVDGLDSGADDFVTKSSDIDVIIARIRALLRVKAYQDRIVEQSEQLRRLYEEVKNKSDKIMELNQRLNKDLQFARRVQEALLPADALNTGRIEIRAAYIPSETLSGDFYDYFGSGERMHLFLADVSGHGLPAAILVSLLKSYLHSEAEDAESLAAFMSELNDFLFTASLPSQYATALLFRIEGDHLTFANAAHPAFLIGRAGQPTQVYEQPGHVLGLMSDLRFEETTLKLEKGDVVFAYTDGLTDRRDGEGVFYSLDRISRILEKSGGAEFGSLFGLIYDDVAGFAATDEFRDDIAFTLARIG
jgi:serine phosphatase RsbU (regulator of sigma subunit)